MANPVELVGGIAIGTGVGAAVGATVTPKLQDYLNEQWAKYPNRPPSVGTLASGVAQGQVPYDDALAWARATGFDKPQFDALVNVANVGPGSAYAFELWRRGEIGEPGFRRALLRLGIEQEWIDDLVKIKNVLLTPAELAVMSQRGVVPDVGLLPVGPPSAVGKVPPMPVADIDVLAEAAGSGYTRERLAALTRIIGLPASPDLAARMVFRNIIDRVDFDRAVSEGNTRNEWADFLFEGFRDIPTSHTFVEGRLRGWLTDKEMYDGTARHGMSPADTHLDFLVSGRPLSWHQVFVGIRRGGVYDGPTTGIEPAFLKALQESNIRPEWYHIAWHLRFAYPSGFMIRGAAQAGDITPTEAHDILFELGWDPKWITVFVGSWTGTAGGTADPNIKKAQTQLWTTLHRSYLAGESTAAEITAALPRAGVSTAAVADVLATWDEERTIIRKQLSPAQVKKAYVEGVLNPDTGAAWTKDEATAALVARGYSTADATTFLEL